MVSVNETDGVSVYFHGDVETATAMRELHLPSIQVQAVFYAKTRDPISINARGTT